jgi:hypothetical protein
MDGPEHIIKFSIKREQIPLNPIFCLIDYKGQGQTFDKLIVDLYKPQHHMASNMHNMHVILSHLRSIEGLVILRDIQIEDIQNINFQEGAMNCHKLLLKKKKKVFNDSTTKLNIKHIQNTSPKYRKN